MSHTLKLLNGEWVWDPPFTSEEEARHKARFADMLESAEAPGCMTDNVFLEGHCRGSQFQKTPHIGNALKARAEAAGQDVTGKVYLGGLARYPGDPEAWVSGRADAQKVVEKRGWGCEGAVSVKPRNETPPKEVDIAPDILAREVAKELANPENSGTRADDIREQVEEKISPPWSKKKKGRKL